MKKIQKLIIGTAILSVCALANEAKADKFNGIVGLTGVSGEGYSKLSVPVKLDYIGNKGGAGLTAGTETANKNTAVMAGPHLFYDDEKVSIYADYIFSSNDAKAKGTTGKESFSHNLEFMLRAGEKVGFLIDSEAKIANKYNVLVEAGVDIKDVFAENLALSAQAGFERDSFYNSPNATYGSLGTAYKANPFLFEAKLKAGQKFAVKFSPQLFLTDNIIVGGNIEADRTNGRNLVSGSFFAGVRY